MADNVTNDDPIAGDPIPDDTVADDVTMTGTEGGERSEGSDDLSDLKATIEALIFASPEPVTLKMLTKILDGEPPEHIKEALGQLTDDWNRGGGLQLVEVANGYQIVTRPELSEWVRRLFHEHSSQRLSVQALETLAVVAYRQPVTGPEIAEIRGVNTSGVLGTLLERRLIKVVGRKAVVGRPFLYATTREFLDRFGLKDLTDLPKVEDMADALGLEVPAGLAAPPPTDDVLPFDVTAPPSSSSEEQVH